MIFEPGKTYRTAEAHEAGVDRDDGREPAPLIGWIDDGGGKFPSCWNRKGHWQGNSRAAPGRNLLPPAPADDAYAAAWRAGAEAMREAAIQHVGRCLERGIIASLPLPTPPAAPAPEPGRLSGGCWVNVYEGGAVECYRQRSYADNFQSSCGNPRIACIRIDLSQHRKGEGL